MSKYDSVHIKVCVAEYNISWKEKWLLWEQLNTNSVFSDLGVSPHDLYQINFSLNLYGLVLQANFHVNRSLYLILY